ncbi:MAG: acetylxylan esterase, partial [Actinomycetes bacterium]|nr:acetylxylan esterase [Actinomycetes bacterium]MDX5380145.1 acetylxylan esterase [Actinomycetes bacterium]MDX5398773.1 acetylxylan esterase [Actinomycetes bacterium]MDX5449861.1 acetylxylan esterase [Actinomycetes bacterium]
MPRFDLPLEELLTYRPPVREPADFEAFWAETIGEARAVGAAASSELLEGHLRDVEIRDVRFPGFGGEPVAAWLLVPRGLDGPAPAVVQYLGYGGGRGLPYDNCLWACAGFVQLVMDTRGQ